MGHTGYRDRLDNVLAACPVHARSTDDLSSPEWVHVSDPDRIGRRAALARYVADRRRREGWEM
jgi:hypothetical protein